MKMVHDREKGSAMGHGSDKPTPHPIVKPFGTMLLKVLDTSPLCLSCAILIMFLDAPFRTSFKPQTR